MPRAGADLPVILLLAALVAVAVVAFWYFGTH
jgi:hypothetical protein